jgi:hypothetical protein
MLMGLNGRARLRGAVVLTLMASAAKRRFDSQLRGTGAALLRLQSARTGHSQSRLTSPTAGHPKEIALVIEISDLKANFAGVVDLGGGVVRCEDETPRSTYFYYLRSASASSAPDFLLVSENFKDDEFACATLRALEFLQVAGPQLTLAPAPANSHGFSQVLLAPEKYHSYFKGLLDPKRANLVLALPVHRCEFTGRETIEQFVYMRRRTISTLDWRRHPEPRVQMRFDNPRTQGGTVGDDVVFKFDWLLGEIRNLNGVSNGFIECSNWRGDVIEVLSPQHHQFVLVRDRKDDSRETCNEEALLTKVHSFFCEA